MDFELRYDPATDSLLLADGKVTVPRDTEVSFSSNKGTLEIEFENDSPNANDIPPKKRLGKDTFVASRPGKYKFKCFINGKLMKGGGDMEVLPPPAG